MTPHTPNTGAQTELERAEPAGRVREPGFTFAGLTDRVAQLVLRPQVPLLWLTIFNLAIAACCMFSVAVTVLLDVGVGTMGNNIPVAWALPIANYVWWIEIAVGGSLLSSILRLARQDWRSSLNRISEAVTLAGICCAGLFPILHLGRAWLLYWTLPYPNTMSIEPNFRSPLIWDVFGLFTYATASLLFWYLDMLPDLAAVRDRARSRTAYLVCGVLALGWCGSATQWRVQEKASILLAGLLTPLVFTIHTVVSLDFATALVPGWHSTIFPPYFVDGAILAGLSMVSVLAVLIRRAFALQTIITRRHFDNLGKLMLTTSIILAYVYVMEPFTAWYSADGYDMFTVHYRATGLYAWTYWSFIALGIGVPQLLWWTRNRIRPARLATISVLVIIGMWEERYMLMVTSLSRDFMPSAWAAFVTTAEDHALLYGSVGLFLAVFFLLVRLLPVCSIYSVRESLLLNEAGRRGVA